MNSSKAMAEAHGMVYVHSAPKALLPHLEWSLGRVLGEPIGLRWTQQPLSRGSFRAEHYWQASVSKSAEMASELAGWREVSFEVFQDASAATEGYRWSHTPTLGLFQAQIDSLGAVLLNEYQVRSSLEMAGSNALEIKRRLSLALGEPWDEELEPLRIAGIDAPTKWLRSVTS